MLNPQTLAQQLLQKHPELLQKIAKATLASANDCQRGLEETLKFLVLAHESRSMACTPSHRIDLVWHEFILFTRHYTAFCQEQFGKFIHHDPATAGQSCSVQYQHTLELYRQKFGPPDENWWNLSGTGTADCGMCDAQ